MMEAERTLKQMHRVYTLATTLEDAKKFAINNNPPYGILMISARCTGEQVESIATSPRGLPSRHSAAGIPTAQQRGVP